MATIRISGSVRQRGGRIGHRAMTDTLLATAGRAVLAACGRLRASGSRTGSSTAGIKIVLGQKKGAPRPQRVERRPDDRQRRAGQLPGQLPGQFIVVTARRFWA